MAAAPSFYHLEDVELADQRCQGTACFVARHIDPVRWERTSLADPRVYCLGRCYAAPAGADDTGRPHVAVDAPEAVVLGRLVQGGAPDLEAYLSSGGYAALQSALAMGPAATAETVVASGLRGRGGAGFPTGQKWRAVLAASSETKYVVANADEGDPGAYIDRMIMEDDPHRVLEGLAIAAVTVGATRGVVYVRKEYPAARRQMEQAVAEATSAGVLAEAVAGGGPPVEVSVVEGKGSYLCGEETALLNALEEKRPSVRVRPPFPSASGLHGYPTLVQNVETLASIPWIVEHGGPSYAAMGVSSSRGTKVVSLNSLFVRPGLYEIEFGLPVREIVERLGGGLREGELRGVLIGGPLAGVLPPHLLDTTFGFDELRAVGAEVGHGGIVAFDEHTSAAELLRHAFRFGSYESCGVCTPCRIGTHRVESILAEAIDAGRAARGSAQELGDTIDALAATSLCAHGSGLAELAVSIRTHFSEEYTACLG
jgi:NADH:ubiquinone oxidoreductase subunit F (NADH-binding)